MSAQLQQIHPTGCLHSVNTGKAKPLLMDGRRSLSVAKSLDAKWAKHAR